MNENLAERFGRSRHAFRYDEEQDAPRPPRPLLNEKVKQYFDAPSTQPEGGPWLQRPEIPSTEEIVSVKNDTTSRITLPEIGSNLPKGVWTSKERYLQTHYELLREDALRSLREIIQLIRDKPNDNEDAFPNVAAGIYDKVHICGVTCSTRGMAIRVTFSVHRSGKKILWEQSKRLITGGLVVLTPRSDMFKTKAVVATIAARPLAALQQNPPEIDIFIPRADEQELDPAQEWVMVEDRAGLYEADRHTLLALQRMMREPFPLSEHLIDAESTVATPRYVRENRLLDMSSVIPNTEVRSYINIDVLANWPTDAECQLDESQLSALRRILTKQLAIIQGPPGTGKTHVSVEAIKIMLANRKENDPPIIIACQTNHAIDQILRHIAKFEPEGFVRLGGRSKDQEFVKARTLFEVRMLTSENPVSGSSGRKAKKIMRSLDKNVEMLLSPLQPDKQPLNIETLVTMNILTEKQAESLVAGASDWVQDGPTSRDASSSPFPVWLGKNLVSVPYKPMEEDYGFEYEEADLEFEQLRELEAENVAKDDEDYDTLKGTTYPIADNFTASSKQSTAMPAAKIQELLNQANLWKIKSADRPAVYRHLQSALKDHVLSDFRELVREYNEQAIVRRIGNWEQDETILRRQKIIGMTTTGLSKYRGLIAALEPKVVLIEEAAETLEAPVTVACLPSLQQLILVGDHQQLRPHCHSRTLEDGPYYLNVSLFERLVNNDVEFTQLRTQRRMIPEVRRLLKPIYGKLILDHENVLDPVKRPNVEGMGGVNSFFFTHQWPEQRDEQMSAFNSKEADMVVNFVEYLAYNNELLENITILTFYNGQRKTILKRLRDKVALKENKFNVVTVDSYQGEENDIVLLSLVRSNEKGQIGFLNNINRVCVALSRARRGFYMFGNGDLLNKYKEHKKKDENGIVASNADDHHQTFWQEIFSILANQNPDEEDRIKAEPARRVGRVLPLRCHNHNNLTGIEDPTDFDNFSGGCTLSCNETLPCRHPCELLCHAFDHELVFCQQACGNQMPCGHMCAKSCGEKCLCKVCSSKYAAPDTDVDEEDPFVEKSAGPTPAEAWRTFAKTESVRYAAAASTPLSHYQKKENAKASPGPSADRLTTAMKQVALSAESSGSESWKSTSSGWVSENAQGKRTRRKKKVPQSAPQAGHAASGSVKKDWSKEASLLD